MFIPRSILTRASTPGPIEPTRARLLRDYRHTSPLIGCRVDPTNRFVFAGAQDNTVQRWELSTGQKRALSGHRSWVRALAFQGDRLFSADWNGKLVVWNYAEEAPRPAREIDAHRGWVRALAVSPDGRLLASCGNDHLVKLWNTETLEVVRVLEGHDCHVYNVAFHPREPQIVSGDLRGNVKQWALADGRETRTMDCRVLHFSDPTFRAEHGGIRSMAFSGDGGLLACAGITNVTNAFAGVGKPAVVLLDWTTGNRARILRPQTNFQGTGWGVEFHPSGFIVGTAGGSGGMLYFWRPDQEQSFHAVTLPSNARDVSVYAEGRRVAIPFFDSAVRTYDLAPPAL